MRRLLKLWWSLTAVLVVLGIGLTTGSASAQKDDPVKLAVDAVDASGDEVVVSGSLVGADPSSLELTVDGEETLPSGVVKLSESDRRNDVVVVIDNAESLGNATVQLAKDAVDALKPGTGAATSLGVITTGGSARVQVGPTSSDEAVAAGLDGVAPLGTSFTWDAVTRAAGLLEERADGSVGTVVLFTGSSSAVSGARSATARSALQRADVRLDVVALAKGADLDTARQLVAERGGTFDLADSDEDLAGAFQDIGTALANRFELRFPAVGESGSVLPLTLQSGATSIEVGYTPGSARTGSVGLAPVADDGGSGGILSSPVVKWLAILMGVVAVVLLVWTIVSMVLPSETDLVSRLEVYEENYGAEAESDVDPGDGGQATVPIIRRAVELTGEMAERRGVLDKMEIKLEQANMPLRAAEAMFFTVAGSVILAVVSFALTGSPILGLIVAALGVAVPIALLNFKVRKRRKAFVSQLPDMLTLLSGTLKAGYSIAQGFESVSTEIDEPMGRELRRVVTETRLGRSLEESLEAVAERMDSDDFAWAVMAIRIQREVGGNLAELLMTVADTMTQRERLRREVSTLTAEGRMSAVIIGLLPPGLAGVLYFMNREYISALFTPGLGYILIGVAIASMGIGFAWMKKTITIEV